MNEHKLEKAEELWREYERHSKEYEKEKDCKGCESEINAEEVCKNCGHINFK